MRKAKLKFRNQFDAIDFYKRYRKTEYEMKRGLRSPHDALLDLQGLVISSIKYDEKTAKAIVKREAVERFHPNNINNKEFWTYAKQKFPKFSVCGSKSKNIKDCNRLTLQMSKNMGLFGFLEKLIEYFEVNGNGQKVEVFEIGYGHGNIFFEIKDRVNYLGIDYYKMKKLNKYKNLLTIDKSGIPDTIKKESYDVVYSVNVLQHCSQHDRFQYLEQAFEILKPGGFFIGSCFIQCEENENQNVWGIEDENGRRYCNFFNQLTEVDTLTEFRTKVESIGFRFVDANIAGGNNFFFVLKKII